MEVPVINRISDFEAEITSLRNPSLVSKIFALSSPSELIHQASSFWKWSPLIVIALLASFPTLIKRIKILIIRFQIHYSSSASKPLLGKQEFCDSDTESSDISSCSSLSDDDEEVEEVREDNDDDDDDVAPSSSQSWMSIDEDFRVKGSGSGSGSGRYYFCEDRKNVFSWPEFTSGKNVVNLWDNLRFEMIKHRNICSVFGLPSVFVSAETSVSGSRLKVWDTRVGGRIPQILAEWTPRFGRTVGVFADGGIEKIYVADDGITGGLAVADGRKLRSPLVSAAESDVDTWWDDYAVPIGDEQADSQAVDRDGTRLTVDSQGMAARKGQASQLNGTLAVYISIML